MQVLGGQVVKAKRGEKTDNYLRNALVGSASVVFVNTRAILILYSSFVSAVIARYSRCATFSFPSDQFNPTLSAKLGL